MQREPAVVDHEHVAGFGVFERLKEDVDAAGMPGWPYAPGQPAAGDDRPQARAAHRNPRAQAAVGQERQLRVRATRRLLSTGVSPARAAAEAGFADQVHLTRWFRRYYGVTPGAYPGRGDA